MTDQTNQTDGTLEVPNRWIPSPRLRVWIYGVLAAGLAAAGVFGLIQPTYADALEKIFGAILVIGGGGLSLAAANVPK